ncbi:hypothetical protein OM076_14365 [Solirubrobacter ginsenosidimutans]|uniref:Uncharacterized protein n=1 Tax=Solirubrobacter ginsenosidimutans TaxID=490573 RepID=A0A9X3S5B9_9ACTN|nr:hypothetical protein [Solirubrobacter ginsenosidimutans]MDA0161458.1 hypothetical protein [Solirubrobacter ginsenosidimutans]
MEERAGLQPADPLVATPASPASMPLGPQTVSLRNLGRAGGMRGGGAALSRAKVVRGMQIGHGNAAVARAAAALAREGDDRARKIAGFNAAKAKGNWGDAAEWLNGLNDEDIQRQLAQVNKNQLRQLDAGAMRQIPSFAGRVHDPILAKLGKAPGSVFGKLNVLAGSPQSGNPYALEMQFNFAPDADIVRATAIAYVQTVRLVHTGTNDDADWQKESKARQTDDHTAVDRSTGGQSGYAGYQTDAQPGPNATEWNPSAPDGFATYTDRPSASVPSTDWSFETAVVGKGGADEGVIYSSCAWGFMVDENFVLTPKAPKISDKPSGTFGAAVDKWNQQAAGPVDQRNAPNQEKLPQVR